ncbi:MAG: UDP-2,3-diacylglucosamine diphosphatase LpxI [Puniceicoccales bacterium]|jgi:DUF1009 family protein|nr:UDP-2,3-diacylglucosamine diphosphatase LpxI [Puniceicoccales bacterium]
MPFMDSELPEKSRIAILAGRGDYPILCARNMHSAGHDVHLIAVDEEVNTPQLSEFSSHGIERIFAGDVSKLLKTLRRFAVQFAIMAGQIKPKRLFSHFPDPRAMLILASLKERNAESIFGAIAKEIENIGVKLLDARSFMGDHIATVGPMSHRVSTVSDRDLQFGVRIAREVARLNIGQSVAVRNGTVLAVEDFAGTDDLILRIGKFNLKNVLFLKTSKFDQDFRFDVPTIGMRTLENLRGASVKYVALEAGSVLILDRANVLNAAKKYGIEIIGF